MASPKRVFVSYSSQDKEAATELTRELETRGLVCWMAPRDIPPGADYSDAIIAGIESCDAMVVLVASAALESTHVRSEVARAASDKKPIYPVRLVDIEILGGLQFFLELSQWVDFFPGPTAESYDDLASAISSGTQHSSPRHRTSINTRRLAIMIIGGVAAVLLLAFVGQQAYWAYQDRIYQQLAEEELRLIEEQQGQREADRAATALEAMTVSASLSQDVDGLVLTRAYIVSAPVGLGELQLAVSINEAPWQAIDPANQRTQLDLGGAPGTSLRFRILDADGTEVKIVDSTDLLRQTLERANEQLGYAFEQIANDQTATCDMSHCYFRYNRVPFCDASIARVSLQQGAAAFTVPAAFCERENTSQNFCVPAQDLPFDLIPGETFDLVFELQSGGVERITRTIVDRLRVGYGTLYAEVPAQPGHADAPVLVAGYTPPDVTTGGFRFVTGWGACDPASSFPLDGLGSSGSNETLTLMVDVDGRGMVAIADNPGAPSNTFASSFQPGDEVGAGSHNSPIRLPAGPQTIEIGFSDSGGVVHGPWRYDFDPAAVVAETAVTADRPVVACSGDRPVPRIAQSAMQRQALCMALQPPAFFDVALVEFGGLPGEFTEEVRIDFSAEDYLANACDAHNGPCLPFRFEVPDAWSNIYSRITMQDGRVLQTTRHQLQR